MTPAEIPALSRDGKLVAFLRGPGGFGVSANTGQIWSRSLPDGEPLQLTKNLLRKQTIRSSLDGTRLVITQRESQIVWNTYELPLFGAQEPNRGMTSATEVRWVNGERVLFSTITAGIHMKLVTSRPKRIDE